VIVICLHTGITNDGQSNLAEDDIILSLSSIIFTRWQHESKTWSLGCILDPHFEIEEVAGGQRWCHLKERW